MGLCASNPAHGHERISKHHFRVERVVGQGGFGVVNAVVKETDPHAGKTFAMKSLRKHVILERNHTEMVFRERNLLARLRHPRLVNMHYAFQDEAHLYIIMDACLGGDLHYQIMQSPSRRFTEMQTKFYAVCILQALEYMHSKGVLHRDIKPENLLLDAKGQLRVTDLGVSGELDSAGNCFSTSGTRPYMAPEVFMSGHKHGKASDLYSLGITLHQFLTGQRPYRASRSNLKNIVRMAAFVPPDSVQTRSHARRVLASAQERRSPSDEFAISRRLRPYSDACIDFVRGLLVCNAEYRLGSAGFKEIYEHPWLADIDIEGVHSETARPPFEPDMSRAQCNVYDSDLARLLLNGEDSVPSAPTLLAEEQAKFEGYDYNTSMRDPADIEAPLPSKSPQVDTRTRTDVTVTSSVRSHLAPAGDHRPGRRISAADAGAATAARPSSHAPAPASRSAVLPAASPAGIAGGELHRPPTSAAAAAAGRTLHREDPSASTGAAAPAAAPASPADARQSQWNGHARVESNLTGSSSVSQGLNRSKSMPSRGPAPDTTGTVQISVRGGPTDATSSALASARAPAPAPAAREASPSLAPPAAAVGASVAASMSTGSALRAVKSASVLPGSVAADAPETAVVGAATRPRYHLAGASPSISVGQSREPSPDLSSHGSGNRGPQPGAAPDASRGTSAPAGAPSTPGSAAGIVVSPPTAVDARGMARQQSLARCAGLESRAGNFLGHPGKTSSSVRSMAAGSAEVVSAVVSMASIRSPLPDLGAAPSLLPGSGFGPGLSRHEPSDGLDQSHSSSPAHTLVVGMLTSSAGRLEDAPNLRQGGAAPSLPGSSAPLRAHPAGAGEAPAAGSGTDSEVDVTAQSVPALHAETGHGSSRPVSGAGPALQPAMPGHGILGRVSGSDAPAHVDGSAKRAPAVALGPLPHGPPPASAGRVVLPPMRSFAPTARGAHLDVLAELSHDERSPSGSEGGVPTKL